MVKILLTSDLHLGINENTPVPDDIRIKTFNKIISLAKYHDLLIIAGDLFHSSGQNNKYYDAVEKEFNDLKNNGTGIIILPGEQEIFCENLITFLKELELLKLFYDPNEISPFVFEKNNQRLLVYGLPVNSNSLIPDVKKINDPGFHIGIFHADFSATDCNESNTADDNKKLSVPHINKTDIIKSNLDFYCLGHSHNFKLFKLNGKYIGAYTGSPESVYFDERGDRYVLSINIQENEIYEIKRLSVNTLKVEQIDIDCSASDNDAVRKMITENRIDSKILTVNLYGNRNFSLNIDDLNFSDNTELEGIKQIYLNDNSIPDIDVIINELMAEDSLKREFAEIFREKIKSNDCNRKLLSSIIRSLMNSQNILPEELCYYTNV